MGDFTTETFDETVRAMREAELAGTPMVYRCTGVANPYENIWNGDAGEPDVLPPMSETEKNYRGELDENRRLVDEMLDKMTPRGLEMAEASIVKAFYGVASNPSGIIPLDLRVLVLPDAVDEKKGSIFIPESAQDREKYAQCKATLIAIGENAWEEAASRSSAFTRPQPGDRVLISKYGGVLLKGSDGVDYRIMNDDDICALLVETE